MFDIVILSVPGTVSKYPPAAPAILKASVESAGFSCKTVDYNIQLYQEFSTVDEIETYFTTGLNLEQEQTAIDLIDKWTEDLINLNPKFIGISVFTYQNRIAAKLFCKSIRKFMPEVKIILGGQGLSDGGIGGDSSFGEELIDLGLADFWIRSEGEISLVELLKSNISYPGINSNSFKQIDNLDDLPFPNYDNYNFDIYLEKKSLPITGSRGCVRSCSFCDIHEHWQYRYRSGQNIVDEIMYLNKTYGVEHFKFTDSLINGNLKEFKKFIQILSQTNNERDNKLTWSSQFIIRSEKMVDETYWKNIALSGAKNLAIGVETGSDSVRFHMNKKFTNEDLHYTMQMLDKYNITCEFLIIVGYPTETDDDFQQTLDLFKLYQPLAGRIIKKVTIGSTLGILPGTPLYQNAKLYNIELDKHENNWIAWDNPDLTLEKRLQRRQHLNEHVENLGFKTFSDSTEHILKILQKNQEIFNKRIQLKKMIRIKQQASVPVS